VQFKSHNPYPLTRLSRRIGPPMVDPARNDARWFALGYCAAAALFSVWAYAFGDDHDRQFCDIVWLIGAAVGLFLFVRARVGGRQGPRPTVPQTVIHFAPAPQRRQNGRQSSGPIDRRIARPVGFVKRRR
jgi:hypothetical protein